jgi:uncharacterized phage-associated protein
MAHSAKAVANYFLNRAEEEGIGISPMKLQKLVYFAQGWHLAFTDLPLIDEKIECWKYGPVIRELFHEFKEFGSEPIDRLATHHEFQNVPGAPLGFTMSCTTPSMDDLKEETSDVLDDVWRVYSDLSAAKLSNMTHLPDTPWSVVAAEHGGDPPQRTPIPNELIKSHFKEELELGE